MSSCTQNSSLHFVFFFSDNLRIFNQTLKSKKSTKFDKHSWKGFLWVLLKSWKWTHICTAAMLYSPHNKLCEGIINWVLYSENPNRGILVPREMPTIKLILNFVYTADWSLLYLTLWSDAFLTAEWSSVNRGSTLVWMTVSFPSADADFRRTGLWGSFSAFKKVVCSWGRNGFSWTPTYKMQIT